METHQTLFAHAWTAASSPGGFAMATSLDPPACHVWPAPGARASNGSQVNVHHCVRGATTDMVLATCVAECIPAHRTRIADYQRGNVGEACTRGATTASIIAGSIGEVVCASDCVLHMDGADTPGRAAGMVLRMGRHAYVGPARPSRLGGGVTLGALRCYVTPEYAGYLVDHPHPAVVRKVEVRRCQFRWVGSDTLQVCRVDPSFDLISVEVAIPVECGSGANGDSGDGGEELDFASALLGHAPAPTARVDRAVRSDDREVIIYEDGDFLAEALSEVKGDNWDDHQNDIEDSDAEPPGPAEEHGDTDGPEMFDPYTSQSIATAADGLLRCSLADVHIHWNNRSHEVWQMNRPSPGARKLRLLGTAKFVRRSCIKLECKLPGHGICGKILYAGNAWDAADEALHTFFSYSACYKETDLARSAGHHEMVSEFVKLRLGQRRADLRAR